MTINILCTDIRQATLAWDGKDRIQVGGRDTTIAKLAQDILEQFSQYIGEEKSVKGRIETSKNLVKALNQLKDRALNRQKELITLIQKVNQTLTLATKEQNKLRNLVDVAKQREATDFFTVYPNTLEAKITFAAFRSVKNVPPLEQWGVHDLLSWQTYSFFGLKKDLEQFLLSYTGSLTDSQKDRINDVIPLLEEGGKMHSQLLNLFALHSKHGAPDHYIESRIADLAYDIEKSIDQLEIGKSILIPGGCQGHAILYQVQRVRESEFQFSLYNTGFGNEFGQLDNRSPNRFRVPLFQKLSKEAVSDRKFLMDLLRYKAKDLPSSMDDVHTTIIKQLKDKHKAKQTTREPHDNQTWSTCSYDSVATFIEYALPPSLFHAFEYDMMLRARGELNSLLPREASDLPQDTLDYINKKSCDTIADWKGKFDTHCLPWGKEDLTIAHMLDMKNIKNQNDLKNSLESWSDHTIASSQKLTFFDRMMCLSGNLPGLIIPPTTSNKFLYGSNPYHLVPLFGALGAASDEGFKYLPTIQFIRWMQKIIDRESPEAAKMLRDRNQQLGNGKQIVLDKKIDLSGTFNYLKTRYAEIAMCIAPLLNATLPPLKYAADGCPNLPAPLKYALPAF